MLGWLALLLDSPHWISGNNRLAVSFVIFFEFFLPFSVKAEILPRQPTPEKQPTNESDKSGKVVLFERRRAARPLRSTGL